MEIKLKDCGHWLSNESRITGPEFNKMLRNALVIHSTIEIIFDGMYGANANWFDMAFENISPESVILIPPMNSAFNRYYIKAQRVLNNMKKDYNNERSD